MCLPKLFTEKNVGGIDRLLRLVVGVVFLAAALFANLELWVKLLFGLIALAGLGTGLLSHCTLYSLIGFSTLPKDSYKSLGKNKR